MPNPKDLVDDPESALEAIDEVLQMIEEIEEDHPHVWDRGEEFLNDVRDAISKRRDTIEESDRVTEAQAEAICNWHRGVCRWHPDHR